MKKPSFADVKSDMEKACLVLRSFTLAQNGLKERDGIDAIRRVNALCDRINVLFATGPHVKAAIFVVNTARTRVLAAEARLAVLRKAK